MKTVNPTEYATILHDIVSQYEKIVRELQDFIGPVSERVEELTEKEIEIAARVEVLRKNIIYHLKKLDALCT